MANFTVTEIPRTTTRDSWERIYRSLRIAHREATAYAHYWAVPLVLMGRCLIKVTP